MERMLGFGQPTGKVMQVAYLVPDLRRAIDFYVSDMGAGPFFILEHTKGPQRQYRGRISPTEVSLAMGFAGHIQFELIQPHDGAPSVFTEAIVDHGFGFHHFGIALDDVEVALPRYVAQGYREISRNPVPTGGEVVFLASPHPAHPGFLELMPATPQMEETFTRFWQASVDWDGSDPIRPFA